MKEIQPIDYCRQTLALKENIESSFLVLGERLSKIKSENLWQAEHGSWVEFLMELRVSEATASKLISVYQTFVVSFPVDRKLLAMCGWDSLYLVKNLVKSQQDAVQRVSEASLLRRDDLKEKVREEKNGVCPHDHTESITLTICKDCAKKWRE